MMSIGQTFTISMRRINKKWNKYVLAMLVFLIPTMLVSALSLASQLIVYIKTGCDFNTFIEYFMFGLSDEIMAELQIDANVMQRTLLLMLPLGIASAVAYVLTIFVQLPMSVYFLNIVRERDMTLGEALKFAWKSVPLTLLTVIKLIPWFLLFIVPGIIKAFAYSQAFYIRYDHPEWSSLECIKHSCKVTDGRKGRLFLFVLLLSLLNGAGTGLISYIFNIIGIFGCSNAFVLILNVANFAANVMFLAYFGVFEQTVLAVHYEDMRRSYLDDVEKNLRNEHESGFADGNHGDPFADNGSTDSTVTYVGEAAEVKKTDDGHTDNNHGDPFGN